MNELLNAPLFTYAKKFVTVTGAAVSASSISILPSTVCKRTVVARAVVASSVVHNNATKRKVAIVLVTAFVVALAVGQ